MMDEPASAIVVTVPKWRIGGSFEGNTRTGVAMGLVLTIPAGTTPTAGALVARSVRAHDQYRPIRTVLSRTP